MIERGVMTKEHALESLLLVNRVFENDPVFLRETRTAEALDAIGRVVSAEALRGKQPLNPAAWGLFLEFVASKPAATP